MSLITAEEISVIRNGRAILDRVSLVIEPHDLMTIIGPNGAGKSTLLKCLMNFFPPDSGTITRSPNLKIGYVPQRVQHDASLPLPAQRFLSLHQPHRRGAWQTLKDTIIAATRIEPILNTPLHLLSGGEMQRVLLARALLREPDLLILDEPAQNLDIASQLAFYQLLTTIHEHYGTSILMVSHDLHLVMASSKKVVCLYHHICCSGEPQTVAQHPEFTQLFGHEFARNIAIYHHSHSHEHDHTHPGHVCDHHHP